MRHDLLVHGRLKNIEDENDNGLITEQRTRLVAVVSQGHLGGGAQSDEKQRRDDGDLCRQEAEDVTRRRIKMRPVDDVEFDRRPAFGGVVNNGRQQPDQPDGCRNVGARRCPQRAAAAVDQHVDYEGQARHEKAEMHQLPEAGAYTRPDPPLVTLEERGFGWRLLIDRPQQAAAQQDQQELKCAFGIEDRAVQRRRGQQQDADRCPDSIAPCRDRGR